ncbi:MAG: hypothetical protein IJE74_05570 [Clostridia bacterium]|nr:hypothetical protein [Clostridia bacterium]
MKTKLLNFVTNIKYEIVIFLMLCVRACLNLDFQRGMDKNFLVYYLVDFSMGKTSRLLIGSLVNVLTDTPTKAWINCFAGIVLILTFILTAILIGKLIKSSNDTIKPAVFVFSMFFASGIFTLYGYSRFFGMLDIYMYLFTVFSLMVVKKRIFKWFVPLFCAGGVLINFSYAISYFPLVALVLLYLTITEKKKAENVALLSVTVLSCLALTLYCVCIGNQTGMVTLEELWATIEKKSGMDFEYSHIKYYDYYLFGEDRLAEALGININKGSLMAVIETYLEYILKYGLNELEFFSVIIGLLPIISFFTLIWCRCIKYSETKPRKFIYLCFILSNLFMVVCFITSTDTMRWACVGVMLQFALAFFVVYNKDITFESTVIWLKGKLKDKPIVVAVAFLVYAFGFEFSITG